MRPSTRAPRLRRPIQALAGAALVCVMLVPGTGAQADPFPRPTPSADPCLEPGGIEDCLIPPTPSPEPSPTPTAPPPQPPTEDEDDGPGGVVGWIVDGITDAINGFFRGLVTDALNPLLDLLGRTLLSTPTIGSLPRVAELWEASRLFAVAAYVLLVMIAGIVVMAHETVQTRYSIKEIAPRIVLGFLAVNLSLMLADQAIGLANAAAQAVLGEGVNPQEAADTLTTLVMGALDGSGIFIIFIGLALAAALVALLITYVVRVALTVILIAGAPLALACHALPQTEGVARWWWRIFLGVLAIQVAQSLTLVTALTVFFAPGGFTIFGPTTDGLVNLIVTLALFYILIKIPFWILQQAQVGGRTFVGGAVKGYLAYKTLGFLRNRGSHSASTRPGPSAPGSGGGMGGPGPRRGGPAMPPSGPSAPGPVSPRSGPGGRGPAPTATRAVPDRLAGVRDRLIVTSKRRETATATDESGGDRPTPGGWPPPVRAGRKPTPHTGPPRPVSRPADPAPARHRADAVRPSRTMGSSPQRSSPTTSKRVDRRPLGSLGAAVARPQRPARRPASPSTTRPPAAMRAQPSNPPLTRRDPARRSAPPASTTSSRPVAPPPARAAGRNLPPKPTRPPRTHRSESERS